MNDIYSMYELETVASFEEIEADLVPVVYLDDEFVEDTMIFDSAGRDIDDEDFL